MDSEDSVDDVFAPIMVQCTVLLVNETENYTRVARASNREIFCSTSRALERLPAVCTSNSEAKRSQILARSIVITI